MHIVWVMYYRQPGEPEYMESFGGEFKTREDASAAAYKLASLHYLVRVSALDLSINPTNAFIDSVNI